jgi:hypothetical protein
MKSRAKKLNINYFVFIPIIFLIFLIVFNFVGGLKSVPHNNNIDLSLSLNRMQTKSLSITETNQLYRHLAFEELEVREINPFIYQVASVFNSIKSFSIRDYFFGLRKDSDLDPKEKGSWLWTPTVYLTDNYVLEIVSGAKEREINTIYLSVDSYLDIFVMEESQAKINREIDFKKTIENFIKVANLNEIEVDALAGWKNWAEEGNLYKPYAVVNFVRDFNAESEYKFRGFQYDVEPYLLERFETEQSDVLLNFTELIHKTENFFKDTDIRFSVVIPDFYDKKDGVTKKFNYNGLTEYIIPHLINILDERKGNSMIVMSYRNFADGEDGSIEVSKNEMKTFKKKAKNTKLIIAQETGDFPPPYITFHNKSRSHLYTEIEKIEAEFAKNRNYGGIAIHYINSYLGMEE